MSDENTPNPPENGLTEQIKWTGPIEPWQDWLQRIRWSPDGSKLMMDAPGTPEILGDITQDAGDTSYLRPTPRDVPPLTSVIPGWENLSTEERVGLLKFKLRKMDSNEPEKSE
jgi:hypothetical protein